MTKKLTFEQLEKGGKKTMEINGFHPPSIIYQLGNENVIVLLKIESDEQKQKMRDRMREFINKKGIKKYWFITEGWGSRSIDGRPSEQKDREELLLINEYDGYNMKIRHVVWPFKRENDKIIWKERSELPYNEGHIDYWDFIHEDNYEEKVKIVEQKRRENMVDELKQIECNNALMQKLIQVGCTVEEAKKTFEKVKQEYIRLAREGKLSKRKVLQ